MGHAFRTDTVRITGVQKTPQGGLDIPASLTRVGVFTYRHPDGSESRELRLPEEVFNADALETLRGAPLTVGHPGIVRADNWQNLAVGHVRDDVHQRDKFVDARVRVQAAGAVKQIEDKHLVELSCSYTCDVEHKSGEFRGEKYDSIQRNIRYNHVAALPEGGGRAGSEVRLHMDSADCRYAYPMDLEAALKEIDRLKGLLTGAETRADAAEKKVAALDVEALVQDRLALYMDAMEVLGPEAKLQGRTSEDIMREVCQKGYPDVRLDGKSEDFLRGLFEGAVRDAKTSRTNVAKSNVRIDAETAIEDKVAEAQKRNEERSKRAWKGGK